MLAHTRKHPTETIRFYGTHSAIEKLRSYASTLKAVEADPDSVPAEEISPHLITNPVGTYLKGIRYREDMTQQQLADTTGIPRRHISEMESGKRSIGKATARKLAETLRTDYRMFL